MTRDCGEDPDDELELELAQDLKTKEDMLVLAQDALLKCDSALREWPGGCCPKTWGYSKYQALVRQKDTLGKKVAQAAQNVAQARQTLENYLSSRNRR